jgi:hypothetical protein
MVVLMGRTKSDKWVLGAEVAECSEQELMSRLREYRPKGLWEFRNGALWINRTRIESPEAMRAASIYGKRKDYTPPKRKVYQAESKSPLEDSLKEIFTKHRVVRWGGSEVGLASRKKGSQYVYFMLCEGYVKVGVARWPEKRLTVIQGGNPFQVTLWGLLLPVNEDPFALEAHLQHLLRPHQVHLEWFKPEAFDLISSFQAKREVPKGPNLRLIRADAWE